MKSVLILLENLSFPFDRRVRRQALALSEAGYRVSVICPKGKDTDREARENYHGIEVYRYRFLEAKTRLLAYLIEYLQALFMMSLLALRVFRARGFDVVHLCNPPDLLFLVALPYKLLGRRVIFDHHDLAPEMYQAQKDNGASSGLMPGILKLCERMTFASVDAVICTNQSYRSIAVNRGRVPESKVFVVRNGPDLESLRQGPARDEPRTTGKPTIFYIGNMGRHDGIDYLLRALRIIVLDRGRSIRAVLVGSGTFLEDMRAYARELGIEHSVEFSGYVSDADARHLLSNSDVCVCPDPYNPFNDASTMQKTLEYMAAGKAVVAFDLTETRASAGASALYAKPNDVADFADQVMRLLDDATLRRRLGRTGQRRIRDSLAWEFSVPHLLAAYEHVLE